MLQFYLHRFSFKFFGIGFSEHNNTFKPPNVLQTSFSNLPYLTTFPILNFFSLYSIHFFGNNILHLKLSLHRPISELFLKKKMSFWDLNYNHNPIS